MDANDWEREMQHLMEMLERESTISLRKINRCFVTSGRPFDENFREYFLNRSNLRLNSSFNAILFERGFENQLPNGSISTNDNEVDVSSDDEDDVVEKQAMPSTNHSVSVDQSISSELTDGNGNPDDQHNRSGLENGNDFEINVKKEIKVEDVEEEMVNLPVVEFDPNKANDDSSIENDVDVAQGFMSNRNQSSSSSNASEQMKRNTLKRFKCKKCSFTSQNKGHFTRHQLIHGKSKPFKCEHCDLAFRRKANLQRHQKIHDGEKLMGAVRDPKDGTYKCPHCDRQFTEFKCLSRHVTRIHKDNQRLFNCLHCLRGFAQNTDKDRHELRCRQRRYECYLCQKYFTIKRAHMHRHMRTHSGVKPFECAICNKCFRQKCGLKSHLNSIHNRISS